MKTIRLLSMGFALALSLGLAAPSFGYTDMLGQTWSTPMAASVSTQIWMGINRKAITGSYGTSSKGKSGSRSAAPATSTIDYGPVVEDTRVGANNSGTSQASAAQINRAVQFRPTGTRLTIQEIISTSGVREDQKPELKAQILKFLSDYEADASAKGLPNDLALALVTYINVNSYVYKGGAGNPNLTADESVTFRNSVAENAARTGIFNNLSDRSKQEMYELFVILGGAVYQSYQEAQAAGNQAELKATKTAAANNLKLVGIKP